MAEINIIPLVDVVLVLLVIFMLTAHVMEYGLEIEVPKVAVQPRDTLEELPVVSLTKRAELYLNGRGVNINQLPAEVRRRFPAARAVYVQADRETIWEPVAQVMGVLGKAKIEVRAVTRPMEPGPAGR
jgi:biopolymer transport protein ExbD